MYRTARRSRLMALELTSRSGLEGTSSTFGELAGNFTGATADMSVVAATADEQIASSLANLSGAVSAFSELVLDAKDTTVATDDQSAGRISDAVPYPTRQGDQTHHVVPLSVLLSVQ
ncbi:hypothetical protein [Gordonia amicalis]|uniref:hypothetical protein n=1 Tax=Gordonia amicalis TaxID=89053 RepID=UPI001EDDBEEE|nr:hypothetical protein [Gordonia amicalis]MDV7102645.1 hypothetical protein [Gordonia amicalis]UKO92203.1 hypothetical protein IHQ52_01840 [Gordonia amicalis]UOG19961.1 hypothetical protein MTX80_11830 [Gordonia amicalis]